MDGIIIFLITFLSLIFLIIFLVIYYYYYYKTSQSEELTIALKFLSKKPTKNPTSEAIYFQHRFNEYNVTHSNNNNTNNTNTNNHKEAYAFVFNITDKNEIDIVTNAMTEYQKYKM